MSVFKFRRRGYTWDRNQEEAFGMRSVTPMKTAKIGYIVLSAVLCVLGLVLILFPEFSASMLGVACGIVLILPAGLSV